MTITDLGQARRRRELVIAAGEWAFAHLPWTTGVFSPEFADRWPDFTNSERMAAGNEMDRLTTIDRVGMTFEVAMSELPGRRDHWISAANWITANEPDIEHPEFMRQFGHISRSELLLAGIERERRLNPPAPR